MLLAVVKAQEEAVIHDSSSPVVLLSVIVAMLVCFIVNQHLSKPK